MKYMQHEKVKISENSIFFVDPIESVDKLYTQRQRWQRGSLEVSKMFLEKRLKPWKMFTDVNVQTLMYDHTFAFPRLIWYLALICLIFCGFSAKTIGLTTALIFAMYIFCGYMYYFAISGFLQEFTEIRKYYRKQWWVIPFMPFFNLLVFFIRVAGVVNSIGTDSAWKTMTLTDEGKAFRGQILKDIDVILSHIKRFRDLVNNDAEKQTT
jgi:cellulose synthase/poly-beta-1,6-N-acetylglucosamine synthase-like glycosyltransferase